MNIRLDCKKEFKNAEIFRFPPADLTRESQPDFHDLHHQRFNVNYGSLGALDWLCGTLASPQQQPNQKNL